jgi:hypothetical protein
MEDQPNEVMGKNIDIAEDYLARPEVWPAILALAERLKPGRLNGPVTGTDRPILIRFCAAAWAAASPTVNVATAATTKRLPNFAHPRPSMMVSPDGLRQSPFRYWPFWRWLE